MVPLSVFFLQDLGTCIVTELPESRFIVKNCSEEKFEAVKEANL